MKKILSICLLISFNVSAQNDTLTIPHLENELNPIRSTIQTLQTSNRRLMGEIASLKAKFQTANDSIQILNERMQDNANAISQTNSQLGVQIAKNEQNANKRIEEVDKSLSKNILYGIIGVLFAIILSGLLYILLRKRQKSDKNDIVEQLNQTKSSIEESLVKEFSKQTNLIDSQLQLIKQQKAVNQVSSNIEPDHSLALKVASEINLIERNIKLMDAGTKGLKQLIRSVGKLKDNLAANGYEIPDLLGKQFHQGMKVIVTSSIPDESLEKDSEIITKVLIPQVNYNERMIQTAQIEVSIGI